jgi:penicillin-binding protein 2
MMDDKSVRIRFVFFRFAVILGFVVLLLRLWQLQVMSSQEFQHEADRNRFRLVPIDAPRGIIYDRFGRMLARNVASFSVSVVPAGLPEEATERNAVLERLSKLLGMPVESLVRQGEVVTPSSELASVPVRGPKGPSIEQLLQERTLSPYAPVNIANNVDRQAAFIIEEEHLKLPGVIVEAKPLRQYIDGPLTAHVLGYVGRIPSERLQDYVGDEKKGYAPDDLVGLTGVELMMESALRGTKGQKHIEVDAFEREVAVIAARPPVQGHNVILTMDLELQRVTEEALREGMRQAGSSVGVAAAMDPRTGEILAMVSLPAYDNNLFSGGISYEDYAELSSDKNHPLVNHAISGQYPPGSSFKIIPASAALQEQVIDRSTTLRCEGILLLPNKYYPDDLTQAQKFRCWVPTGHGSLNVVGALLNSCDIFFYELAGGYRDFEGLGIERLGKYMHMFGFGEPTGMDLSGEAAGLVPSDRWKRQNYGESWVTGDTYNAGIGQGFVLATPLQMLNATAAVANGGTLYRPQLVYRVTDAQGQVVQSLAPEVIRKLDISAENLAIVRQGMLEAVVHGTAWRAQMSGLAVAGKTGTAEFPAVDEQGRLIRNKEGLLPTHAWFVAFAPYEDPEIALVVFLEAGGEGARNAVPVAARILRYYFGLPEPTPAPTQSAPGPTPTITPGAAAG